MAWKEARLHYCNKLKVESLVLGVLGVFDVHFAQLDVVWLELAGHLGISGQEGVTMVAPDGKEKGSRTG